MEVGKNIENLTKVTNYISDRSIFQKKMVKRFFEDSDSNRIDFAEDYINRLNHAIGGGLDNFKFMANAYVDYSKMIRLEEMHFAKEKKYRYSDYSEVYDRVYGDDDHMLDYVVGLGMTQIFWVNHFKIVSFFIDSFIPKIKDFECGAEIGVGHGLFHSELLRGAPKMKSYLLDISPISLDMTTKMIKATGIDEKRATRVNCDVQKEMPIQDGSLDALLMGELIEHLQDGESFLSLMTKKMKKEGYCFFTTAANAPAEDHILHFKNVGEIRDMLNRTGWSIVKENIDTMNGMSLEEAETDLHNINYAAVIKIK